MPQRSTMIQLWSESNCDDCSLPHVCWGVTGSAISGRACLMQVPALVAGIDIL